MSEHPYNSQEELVLPSPKPSADLDGRILRYARDNTPASATPSNVRHPVWWAGGLTSAAIAVVTLFAVLTPGDILTSLPSDIGLTEQSATGVESALLSGVTATMRAAPRSDETSAVAAKTRAASESVPMADEANYDTSVALGAAEAAASKLQQTSPAVSAFSAAAAAAPAATATLQGKLQRLAQLLQDGQPDAAQRDYRQLRRDCRDCDLPQTLEQALQQYTPDTLLP